MFFQNQSKFHKQLPSAIVMWITINWPMIYFQVLSCLDFPELSKVLEFSSCFHCFPNNKKYQPLQPYNLCITIYFFLSISKLVFRQICLFNTTLTAWKKHIWPFTDKTAVSEKNKKKEQQMHGKSKICMRHCVVFFWKIQIIQTFMVSFPSHRIYH